MSSFTNLTNTLTKSYDEVFNQLADHLATDLEVDREKLLESMVSFGTPKPKVVAKAVVTPKAKAKAPKSAEKVKVNESKSSQDDNDESVPKPPKGGETKKPKSKAVTTTPKCGWKINEGKDDEKDCNKNAKLENEIDGIYYCGTEASGHYKSALAKSSSKSAPKAKSKAKAVTPSPKTVTAVKKITKRETFTLSKETSDMGPVWLDKQTSLVFDKESELAYGVLKNKKVLPLDEENIRVAESNDIKYDLTLLKKLKSKSKSKSEAKDEDEEPVTEEVNDGAEDEVAAEDPDLELPPDEAEAPEEEEPNVEEDIDLPEEDDEGEANNDEVEDEEAEEE